MTHKSRWLTIRPSTTLSTPALRAKSLLNAVLFFGIFMVLLPWGAQRLLPGALPFPLALTTWGAGGLFVAGIGVWIWCLEVFSRQGRGTPLPLDAPRRLVEGGPFARVRNPIMAAELAVIWAEAFYFASFGIVVYAAAMSLTAHLMVVYIEEPELRERFGESYKTYCERVPRWVPRLGRPGWPPLGGFPLHYR